jgi:hypothetical protein
MSYLVPVLVILMGMASRYIVELSSELSTSVFLDTEAGIESAGTQITADPIVDMRPETAILGAASPGLPDLLRGGR